MKFATPRPTYNLHLLLTPRRPPFQSACVAESPEMRPEARAKLRDVAEDVVAVPDIVLAD